MFNRQIQEGYKSRKMRIMFYFDVMKFLIYHSNLNHLNSFNKFNHLFTDHFGMLHC